MSPHAIPEKCEDVTPEWLEGSLRRSGVIADQRVVDVAIEPLGSGYGMNSNVAILRPTYSQAGTGPSTMFAKFVSQIEGKREFASHFRVFKREIDAYRNLGGKLPIRMPRYYFGDYVDESDVGVLMIELVEGRRIAELAVHERRAGLSKGTQRVALAALARMHSEWSDSSRLDGHDWLPHWTE